MSGMDVAESRENPRTHLRRPGFTLIEALIASTILAVVAASAALPFVAGTQQVQESAKLENAVALGEALMEEILARPFFEEGQRTATPGPEADETRRDLFDSIDDFHGLSESAGDMRDYLNAVIADEDLADFRRTVTAEYVTMPNQAADDSYAFIHIQVIVYYKSDPIVTLDRIAAREY